MASLADRTIRNLRDLHDELAALVPNLTDAQLAGPSGAADWTVAQVLSHLGSGGEISLATYVTALTGAPGLEPDFNQTVWDRWNAMAPRDQSAEFLVKDAALIEALEALTPDQRENLEVELAFLPFPLGVPALAGMRLNEMALHGWDVRVGVDAAATVSEESAQILLEQFSGGMSFMLGFVGKAGMLSEAAVVDALGNGLVIAESVSLSPTAEGATATFNGPLESFVRLIGGRLTPAHTPDAVDVTGNVSLDDLRRVFPGF